MVTLRVGCPMGILLVVVVSSNRGLGDEVQAPWLLQSVTTSEEDEAHSRG
jgi:hypothetical protein